MATDDYNTLARRVDQLATLCAQLSDENADLRRRVDGPRPRPETSSMPGGGEGAAITRRGMFGKALGAAAAGVAGVTLLDSTPAAATDGDAVKAGNTTLAEHTTVVTYDGVGGFIRNVLLGNDSTHGSETSDFPAGVAGYAGAGTSAGAGGIKNGVYGRTDAGGGNAVIGWNTASDGHTGGAAVTGLSDDTQGFAMAVYGEMSNATPGGFSAGVRGVNRGSGALGIGVYGSHDGSGWGVYGSSLHGIGVNGSGKTGVYAAGAVGVHGKSNNGRGGVFEGAKAQLQLKAGTRSTHPTAGARGDLYVDSRGRLWFCKTGGAHATWSQLA